MGVEGREGECVTQGSSISFSLMHLLKDLLYYNMLQWHTVSGGLILPEMFYPMTLNTQQPLFGFL